MRIMQQHMMSKIFRRAERVLTFQQAWAAHGIKLLRKQRLREQSGPERRNALPNGNVYSVALEIRQPLFGIDPHVNIGIGIGELTQTRDKPFRSQKTVLH